MKPHLEKEKMRILKQILLFLMSAGFAITFIPHGWMKFDSGGFWSKAFIEQWGYGLYFMYLIGVLELCGGILILIPRVWQYGALILATVMLGALITRLVFGTSVDDALWIASAMVTLLYITLERGIDKDLEKLMNRMGR